MADEKKYRCLANILTQGEGENHFRGQLISEGKFKQLSAKIRKKFELVSVSPILSGSGEQIAKSLVELETKNGALKGELESKNKEIERLKKEIANLKKPEKG
jgi:dynactin complex subunit